jgi:phosphopantothenoylcysteine decarboxylase / phosphopantothenate---cysteine ligase
MTDNGWLSGKLIVLGVTGSIAAVQTVKLCHELRRQGATVQAVMSEAARGIINPESLVYATGRPVITTCTGLVEHVQYCGEGGQGDLLLIAPCTANTIGKIAAGIDDTAVTTFATTAIGRGIPVIVAPAMHESMYRHPAVRENLRRLESFGITVIPPKMEEQRAKVADVKDIVLYTARGAGEASLRGKSVLVTSGACREPVDDVRVLTTRATGMMGKAVALEAFRLGADVTVVHRDTFTCVRNIAVSSAEEMRRAVLDFCGDHRVDFYISAAAISDFSPQRTPGKIPSGTEVTVRLTPLPKLLPEVAGACKGSPVIVAFKLGNDEEERARQMIEEGVAMVVINAPDVMGSGTGKFVIVTGNEREELEASKVVLAAALWKKLL